MTCSKRIFSTILLLLVTSSLPLVAQKKVPDLERLSRYERITEVFLSEHMLKESQLSFGKMEDIPENFNMLLRCVNSIRIFVAENPKEMAVLRDVFSPLKECSAHGTERIMSIRKKGNEVNLVGMMDGNLSHGLYLMVDTPDNATAIIFGGEFTRGQLEQMMRQSSSHRPRTAKAKSH